MAWCRNEQGRLGIETWEWEKELRFMQVKRHIQISTTRKRLSTKGVSISGFFVRKKGVTDHIPSKSRRITSISRISIGSYKYFPRPQRKALPQILFALPDICHVFSQIRLMSYACGSYVRIRTHVAQQFWVMATNVPTRFLSKHQWIKHCAVCVWVPTLLSGLAQGKDVQRIGAS